MEITELRDPEEARTYLLQGLWLQRVVKPNAALARIAIEWALAIVSEGQPLPPLGFVADLGTTAYGLDRGRHLKESIDLPGRTRQTARLYEDHVLGKVFSDWSFERATDALRRYQGRDQAKGLAYVVKQIRERAGIGGVELSPAVLRGFLNAPIEELLQKGYDSLSIEGPTQLLTRGYGALVAAFRRVGDLLGPEDLIALEQRTALADMGQYVAHRQILRTTAAMEAGLPQRPVRPRADRRQVPTRVLDEDQYPVGGYSSIATKGSIESLLHSQLAYMDDEPPDLFDMKFVRDELFYYSRDENRFLRRRRHFVFALFPNLVAARYKDAELEVQRIVIAQATVLALVRRLSDWLGGDALRFEILFVNPVESLAHEAELFELLLQELIARGAATIQNIESMESLHNHCELLARASQVHCLTLATDIPAVRGENAVFTKLGFAAPTPQLVDGRESLQPFDRDLPASAQWSEAVRTILELWI